MKAYEFPSKIRLDGTLEIPNSVLSDLSTKRVVKVILLVEEPLVDEDDEELSAESFRESWE